MSMVYGALGLALAVLFFGPIVTRVLRRNGVVSDKTTFSAKGPGGIEFTYKNEYTVQRPRSGP